MGNNIEGTVLVFSLRKKQFTIPVDKVSKPDEEGWVNIGTFVNPDREEYKPNVPNILDDQLEID